MAGGPSTPGTVLASTARVPTHVVYRKFPAEVVLLNLNTGRYHGLNPTAGAMLRALERHASVAAAAAVLASELDADRDRIEADLVGFVLGLEDRGLIEVERPVQGAEAR